MGSKKINILINESKENDMTIAIANLLGVKDLKSLSSGIKLLLERLVYTEDSEKTEINDDGNLLKKSLMMSESQCKLLTDASKKHCWSFSKEVRFRLAHTLNDDFDLFDPELREFNLCRHAINRIGRNLRNILVENQNIIMDRELFAFDVNDLRNEIIGLNKKIDNYVALCGNRKISSKVGRMYATKD